MISAEQVSDLLLRHWDVLGNGQPTPPCFAFLLVTKGREPVSKLVLLAFPDGEREPRFAVKLPRSKEQNASLEAEYRNLGMVAPFGTHGRVVVPAPLLCGDEKGWLWLVESVVAGTELSQAAGARSGRFVDPVVDWLVHLGQATVGFRPPSNAAEDLSELLARARRYTTTEEERNILGRVADHLRLLDAESLPRVFEQRDMGTWNLLVSETGTIGVLDWESSRGAGFPGWDLFYFLAHYGFMVYQSGGLRDRMKSFESTFWGHDGFADNARAALRRYTDALDLREEWLGPLSVGCWLHHTLSEASRLGIKLSDSLFWHMLTATVGRDCRLGRRG